MAANNCPCVIEPRKGRNEQCLPGNAVLVFSPEDLASFSACLPQPPVLTRKLYLTDLFTALAGSAPLAIAGPMLGAPQTILVLEKMIALGAARFIAVGWCGSLSARVKIGDIVLPLGAVSEEGTSSHYPECECAPSYQLIELLRPALQSTGKTIHEGMVWTTDAPFRETCAKVKSFQTQNILAVDMETSALFSVARFRGVELGVVLVVSDDLSSLKWVHGFRDAGFKQSRQKVIQSVLTLFSGK
ncbi:MAG: nucleoside phosphorylase [Syntrophobacteraceae bacterium]